MISHLYDFLLHWGIMSLSLWVASHVFGGLQFSGKSALLVSALMLGFANAILRPFLVLLTLPLTFLTFGLFLLVINAAMVMLAARLVPGFVVESFWWALGFSLLLGVVQGFLNALDGGQNSQPEQ